MLKYFLILFALLCGQSALAEGCGGALDTVLKNIGAQQVIKLEPEQAANVLIWWNEQEPKSNDTFTTARIVTTSDHGVGLLMGNDDKVCAAIKLKPEMIGSLMDAIAGHPPADAKSI
jgi:hypothetical protein